MIDLSTENAISLAAAAKLIPPGRNGKRCHLSTLLRWILTGAKNPSGAVVKLDASRLGARWVTSREAIQRFMGALTPRLDGPPAPAPRTSKARSRANARAERELTRVGI
jgi:hypothetical protein